jgi:VanZ family protein
MQKAEIGKGNSEWGIQNLEIGSPNAENIPQGIPPEAGLPPSEFHPPPSAFRILFRYWLPLIAYCLLIFIQSSSAGLVDLPAIPQVDKLLHGGGYSLLGILFYRAYRSRWPNASAWTMANASFLSGSFYGVTDEIHQHFVPGRSADPWDWLADTVGALLGVMAYRAFLYVAARRSLSCRD